MDDPAIPASKSSALTIKQRDCAQRNLLLRRTNQKVSASIQNEHNQFERNMDFQAKQLRKKLTLLIPGSKPNAMNDTRLCATKEDNSAEENGLHNLKLPVIKTQASSAPSSPTLDRRNSNFSWNNIISMSPPSPSPLTLRRGSYNDISDSPRSSPSLSRTREMSRSFSYHRDRRATLMSLSPPSPGLEDGNVKSSPSLLPRNLKLREQARQESILKASEVESPPLSPTLEDQFKSLGTCRYLRRGTLEALAVKVLPDDES